MLTHYRLVRLKVEGLGPATVGIDAHGRSLYAEEQASARARLPALMGELEAARRQPHPAHPEQSSRQRSRSLSRNRHVVRRAARPVSTPRWPPGAVSSCTNAAFGISSAT